MRWGRFTDEPIVSILRESDRTSVAEAAKKYKAGDQTYYVRKNGTPLFALQELGGWSSTETVRRYAHLAADHLAPYAQRPGAVRAPEAVLDGTNLSQG